MSPRKKPEPGAEALRWLDATTPEPVRPPAYGEPPAYGWIASLYEHAEGVRLRAVVLTGTAHAIADARPDEPDPRRLLSPRFENRYAGGWSQGSTTCYLSPTDAVLALRLETQRRYAKRLAALDAAIGRR